MLSLSRLTQTNSIQHQGIKLFQVSQFVEVKFSCTVSIGGVTVGGWWLEHRHEALLVELSE